MTNGYRMPRQPGKYDVIAACEECCIHEWEPSKTIQSQAEEADINTIVKRFGLTGQLPDNIHVPTYGDFTNITDYKTAMDAVTQAHSNFMLMPAALRARFDNDPQQFVEFASDPENQNELLEMGLAKPRETPAPPTTPTAGPTAQPTEGKPPQGG